MKVSTHGRASSANPGRRLGPWYFWGSICCRKVDDTLIYTLLVSIFRYLCFSVRHYVQHLLLFSHNTSHLGPDWRISPQGTSGGVLLCKGSPRVPTHPRRDQFLPFLEGAFPLTCRRGTFTSRGSELSGVLPTGRPALDPLSHLCTRGPVYSDRVVRFFFSNVKRVTHHPSETFQKSSFLVLPVRL